MFSLVGSVQALKRLKLAWGVQHASEDHSWNVI